MSSWPPIDRDDLKEAATRAAFDTDFPLLVRRLIAETADGLTELDMPGGSGVAAGGFDGVVTADGNTPEVPAGRSVWELSVTPKAQAKADKDYGKRLEGPEGSPTSDCTYVQVILAPWLKSRTWSSARRKEGRWKDVLALNVDRVHAWLDQAPATTAWLAERLNKAMPGVRPVDAWWTDTWLPSTQPPLGPDVVLAGRNDAAQALVSLLLEGRSVLTLSGDLGADSLRAFVGAALVTADGPVGEGLRARALHVTDGHSLKQLVRQPSPLVLVLDDAQLAADLPVQHPHQLVLVSAPGQQGDVVVPPVDAQQAETALRTAGIARERVADLGRLARRSLPALRRALALNGASLTPAWAAAPDVIRRRLALIGAWHGDSDSDRAAVARCAGRSYDDVQEAALALARGEGPMLGRVGESWHLTSPQDSWLLLRASLTKDDLAAFSALAVEVLSEAGLAADADADADAESHPLVGATSPARGRFSGALRRGVARTLALLAVSDRRDAGRLAGPDRARLVARELFDAANSDRTYALWVSLSDVLPLLAEAAPDEFLCALRDGLTGEDPLHAKMFQESPEDGLWAAPSPHTGFLWSLETVAWATEHFDDAVDVLARLAALDPGGRLANRPARSLAEVLSLWHPETAAGEEQRHRALRRVLQDEPAVARRLLLDLLPDAHGFQTDHRAPEFRTWKQDPPATSRDDLRRRTADVAGLLLDDLDDDPERHLAVIGRVDDLPQEQLVDFTARLTALAGRLDDDDARSRLHDALRDKTARHREYADTAWAMPDSELVALEAATEALRPRDPVRGCAWLFASDWVELGDVGRRDDLAAYDAELARRRADAVRDIVGVEGLDGVLRLADVSGSPHAAGAALAVAQPTHDAEMTTWLAHADDPSQAAASNMAYGYVSARLRADGSSAVDAFLAMTNDPAAQALVLKCGGDPVDAWRRLEGLPEEVKEQYWKYFSYYGLGRGFDRALDAVRGLLGAGRRAAALHMVVLYLKSNDMPEAAGLVVDALEALLASGMDDPELRRLDSHDYERLFALLGRHRTDVGEQRVVNLEWQFFPALGYEANAPALHGALSEQPAFFAELVRYLYQPDTGDGPGDDEQPTDPKQRREFASRAFSVLRSWRRCPTTGPDLKPEPETLREWVEQARAALAQDDRLGPGDSEIGQALAWAAPDDDGTSPPRAVRDLLEEVRSDRLDRGLEIGIYNRRGVTSRGVFEGGKKERELADGYRDAADAAVGSPRTAKLLRRLADSYERDAELIEGEAEGLRRGVDT
ncbi:hypothetical protein [Cellulomonas iranensis]|uniref:hypothetical protein n=1 Tax=Cellulomonas iranensis TaxID=76862 RepID=UPI000B3C918F|nr:hypothetical protein [Cellulomonas iranensis]